MVTKTGIIWGVSLFIHEEDAGREVSNNMVGLKDIQNLTERITHEFSPQKIILFGSFAWGIPKGDSDVDLLVIMPHEGKSWRMASTIRERVQPDFPLDLLVRSEDQILGRLALQDSFISEIMERGRVLYENGNC